MNERIKALAIESGAFTWSCGDEGGMNSNWLDPEKFAELIIKECAELMRNDPKYWKLLEHFGVEE
jgi:hypothetical protein